MHPRNHQSAPASAAGLKSPSAACLACSGNRPPPTSAQRRALNGWDELVWHPCGFSCGRGSSSPSGLGWTLAVVGGSEAAADVVIDDADVLHECIHARRPDEAVSLRLQLLGECVRLWCRRGEVCEGPWRTPTGALVGPRQRGKTRRRGPHRARVLDGGLTPNLVVVAAAGSVATPGQAQRGLPSSPMITSSLIRPSSPRA